MAYFSRRNEYIVEYSGHEEASDSLRQRFIAIMDKYVADVSNSTYHVSSYTLLYAVQREFPHTRYIKSLVTDGLFHEFFTVLEIFLSLSRNINLMTKEAIFREVSYALELSGSVYKIANEGSVELKINKDVVEKIDSIKRVLAPYPEFSSRFFQAVGNLVGRRAKPEDVVKDIFVASEGYLKSITETSRFGDAIKDLDKQNIINKEQKKVLEALHQFRSDADGAGHAGNSETPTEETALWFLDTMVAQLRMISKKFSNQLL